MDWLRRQLATWRTRRASRIRRIIVLVIGGLELQLVDDYLEQGLLHSLALLGDIGGRVPLRNPPTGPISGSICGSICDALGKSGVRMVELLPVEPRQPADLAAICAADRDQQERLFGALARSRPVAVVCVFDMPARLQQLFGPQPDASQRYVLRDTYARMDEIVGKAFSFVDARSALLAVIHGPSVGEVAPTSTPAGLLFSSRKLTVSGGEKTHLEAVIAGLLRLPTHEVWPAACARFAGRAGTCDVTLDYRASRPTRRGRFSYL